VNGAAASGALWSQVQVAHAGANTVTCNVTNGTDIDLIIIEYPGGPNTVDQKANSGGFSTGLPTNVTTAAITTTVASELILTFVYDNHTNHNWTVTASPSGTFTIQATSHNVAGGETGSYADQSVSGIQTGLTVNWNGGTGIRAVAFIASFKIPQSTGRGPKGKIL
jgi:hypothetical protein